MYTLWTYDPNIEILKPSAAPETHFKSIFMFGESNCNIVG